MMNHKKRWWVLGGLTGLALGWAGWANRRLFTVNDITTGESASYPELRSRVYYAEPGAILIAAEQAVRSLARWRVVRVDEQNHALDAAVDAPVGRPPGDVTVYLNPLGGGQTRAVVRSHSRTGRGDLGQNAAHIRALQGEMDRRLTVDRAF